MAKAESRLQRRIRKALRAEFGGYWFKVWGGPFQPAGIPDLHGDFRPHPDDPNRLHPGRSAYVEVKTDDGEISAIQVERMRELMDAGAIVCVATSPEEACEFVRLMVDDLQLRFCFGCLRPRRGVRSRDERGSQLPDRCESCGGEL